MVFYRYNTYTSKKATAHTNTILIHIKGFSINGRIEAGFGFHIQKKDFAPETFAFSTSGYTVMIVRGTNSPSKFTVRARYISGTTVKALTSDFSFLSGNTDEKITLSV